MRSKRSARLRWVILLVLSVVGLGLSLGVSFCTGDWSGLWLNLGTELLGAVLVYVLIDRFVKRGEEQERAFEYLIVKMRSSNRDKAIEAVEELRRLEYLCDGSLQHAQLPHANLEKAGLHGADLRWANLHGVNLKGAHLHAATLEGEEFDPADLRGANLYEADIKGAHLDAPHLRGVIFDEETVLPDGRRWTPDTDMEHFTNPDHPQFWRSPERA